MLHSKYIAEQTFKRKKSGYRMCTPNHCIRLLTCVHKKREKGVLSKKLGLRKINIMNYY